jgi:hypothetical protein
VVLGPYRSNRFRAALDPLNPVRNLTSWIAPRIPRYLWVTAYYARQSAAGAGSCNTPRRSLPAPPWTLPFSRSVTGAQAALPDAGLAMLVAATVSIHHFVLDGDLEAQGVSPRC